MKEEYIKFLKNLSQRLEKEEITTIDASVWINLLLDSVHPISNRS